MFSASLITRLQKFYLAKFYVGIKKRFDSVVSLGTQLSGYVNSGHFL